MAALAAALDAVVTIDHRGHVLDFNRAAEETFGYRREDVLGRELAELIVPPAAREAHRRGLARWTSAGPAEGAGALLDTRLEVVAQNARGEEFPVELAISRLDVEGPPLFTACVREISERRRSEEKLRAAELRYRSLVEQLHLVVYVDEIAPGSPNLYTSAGRAAARLPGGRMASGSGALRQAAPPGRSRACPRCARPDRGRRRPPLPRVPTGGA